MPDWNEASHRIDGSGAKLGIVDATVETNLAGQFGIKGFPTIKIFPGGAPPKLPTSAQDYMGGRTASHITKAVLDEVDRTGVPEPIPEMTSQDVLLAKCEGQSNKLCVLFALPHILESMATGREKYNETMTAVAKSFRGTPFDFLWFEGGNAQTKLEQALDLTFGFPAVVALSLERNAYSVLRGAFSEKSIGKFLRGITAGRQPTTKLEKELPKVVMVEPWNGLDGIPIEEEPLDDIMGVEL